MKYKLYPHQQKFISTNAKRTGLFHDVGCGKTISALAWVYTHHIRKTFIILPLAVLNKWRDTIIDCLGGEVTDTDKRFHKIETKNKQIIIVVTKEYWRDKVDKKKAKADGLIIDESHFFSNNSKLTKETLRWLKIHDPEYRLIMTATPYVSSSINIYYASKLLGYEVDYMRWRYEFQTQRQFGARVIWEDRQDPDTKSKLQDIIKKIGYVLAKEDIYDVPDQSESVVWVPKSSELANRIDAIVEENEMAFFIARHRLEQEYKLEKTLESIKGSRRTIVVFRYRDHLEQVKEELSGVEAITGDTKNKEEVISRLQKQKQYTLLVQASISEGWELPDTDTIVFAGHSWSYKDLWQMKGRAIRISSPSETSIVHILTEGGSDARIWKSLSKKEDFNIKNL